MNFVDGLRSPEREIALAYLGDFGKDGSKSDAQVAGYLANGTLFRFALHYLTGRTIHEFEAPEVYEPLSGLEIKEDEMPEAMRRLKDALKKAGAPQDWLQD